MDTRVVDNPIREQVRSGLDVRDQFPFLEKGDIAFFDTAASAQKPACVLEAIQELYTTAYANVHRGVYRLAEEATARYEACRDRVQAFVNAARREEIVLTSGATESVNIVAHCFPFAPGDVVVTTLQEHHANFVPWQHIQSSRGVQLELVELDEQGCVIEESFYRALEKKPRLVAFNYISNALGSMNPVEKFTGAAHDAGAVVLLDAAQAAPHRAVDVQSLGVDFLAFSAHKMYGPTGIGALYGKFELLNQMTPFVFGGEMIARVTREGTSYQEAPFRFEAGTPNIAGAAGFTAAIDFVEQIGLDEIAAHEHELVRKLEQTLPDVPGLRILGPHQHEALVPFVIEGLHHLDIAHFLDKEGLALRAGHHCAEPLQQHLGVNGTLRASVGVYNTAEDVERLVRSLHKACSFFR